MEITETIKRTCCQRKDLKPVEGAATLGQRLPEFMFCSHCGHYQELYKVTDAAGSPDWEYRKIDVLHIMAEAN